MVTPLPKSNLNSFFANPKFREFASNALTDLGYGLTRGTDLNQGFQLATQRTAEMQPQRDAYATSEAEKAQRLEQLNKTVAYLRTQQGGSPWADAVENGLADPKDAFKGWYEQSQGMAGPEPTANMRDFQYAQENPGYAEFLGGGSGNKKPASVQEYEYAREQGFTGTFNDYQTQQKQASRSGTMNATVQKELFEADEGIQAGVAVSQALDRALVLNDTAWDGPVADLGTQAGALVGDKNSVDTQELKNLVTSQALDQLKATFGSMPTEGERKILLEIQGSVTQSREVRKRIFERAKAAVERRVKYNQSKAEGLRSGEYFQEGYGTSPAGGATATSTGVQWSYEP